ncbi:MAG TPA: hypothetical protein VFZ53_20385 [Polyangiaceae bacterium]
MLRRRPAAVLAALGLAALLVVGSARARVEADSGYTKTQTYSGALRYLRVDLGYEVVERDPDAAYLIFRYAPNGPAKDMPTGTVEVVETESRVKVFVQIPRMPEYHERVLRDGLLRKLREEYGVPPPRIEKKPSPDAGPPVDGGAKD